MPEKTAFSDLQKERRNLMAVSVILLLFMLVADSNYNNIDKFSMLGGAITINKPAVLFLFAWIYLLYSLLRFRIYSADTRGEFQKDVKRAVWSDRKFKKHVNPKLEFKGYNEAVLRDMNKNPEDYFKFTLFRRILYVDTERINSVPLSFWLVKKLEIRYAIKHAVQRAIFTDYILPYWLTFSAIIIGLWIYVISPLR